MDIRNSLDGLKSLLGVDSMDPAAARQSRKPQAGFGDIGSDSATLSNAANEVSMAIQGDGVRTDKVASIQSALAEGTYAVPASAIASKVVDAMLGVTR
jgi:flagellar biosynthesis anti-sigma factor FlgM